MAEDIPRRTQAERTEATRRALLDAARELFAEKGFADTGTEEIVRAAGVTRGALYHHFRDKTDLLHALVEELESETTSKVMEAAARAGPLGTWEHLLAGCEAFLDECLDPAVRRIILIDAPSALGWERWREIQSRHALWLVQTALQAAMDAGLIAPQPIEPLSHLFLGGLTEAALAMTRAEDVKAARRQTGESIEHLLRGLSQGGTPRRRRRA
jgi:AcrR family transcriptional regulator